MKKILIIAGPALGHVGRLLNIAKKLQNSDYLTLHCVSPDIEGYVKKLFSPLFKTFLVPIPRDNAVTNCLAFANAVNKLIVDNRYDLVIYDANPLAWITLLKLNNVPTVCITNVFLTQFGKTTTYQEDMFLKQRDAFNSARLQNNLPEIESTCELYEADLVLLADPNPIVTLLVKDLPMHYRQVGACIWESDEASPKELEGMNDIFLMSMGSTGPFSMDKSLFEELKKMIGANATVYAGNRAKSLRQHIDLDLDFEWLPLGEVLRHTKAVLSQGGVGSTYQALQMGIPTFILPGHKNHQIFGDLITQLGVGLCMGEDFDAKILANYKFEDMQSAAKDMSKQMHQEDGVGSATGEILELLNS